ncbi:peptidoglycan editing factor PgeF [Arsenicitalea aurantiaca]|uniref:Purine nucleoside phosphorylase n=1 Tax=Arsenicitalea aurantiaca TaxID=1783274 RepID=A0A433XLK7_9HYPH|nr:peptidoglycan editing factor PgeF [Arsenicitalea aurantiaca]RUT34966.1 peptidoglycan editing factor PgeF [Arsenicitalea aurantiaca]
MSAAPFIAAPALSALPGIAHGFFTREGGVSGGVYESLNVTENSADDPALVAENRRRVALAFGLAPDRLAGQRQVHSARVVTLVEVPAPGARPEGDAMVTDRPGIALGILTADCTPILLADPEAGIIGAAHAGWQGAVDGIVGNTVEAMAALGADPARITAAIGPTISGPSYEVGDDFVAALRTRNPAALARVFTPPGGRPHFDLPGFVGDCLAMAGVTQVTDLALCTYADPRFFSHRRATHEGTTTGRQIAVILRR